MYVMSPLYWGPHNFDSPVFFRFNSFWLKQYSAIIFSMDHTFQKSIHWKRVQSIFYTKKKTSAVFFLFVLVVHVILKLGQTNSKSFFDWILQTFQNQPSYQIFFLRRGDCFIFYLQEICCLHVHWGVGRQVLGWQARPDRTARMTQLLQHLGLYHLHSFLKHCLHLFIKSSPLFL